MARPKKDITMETISVRLPKSMLEEIDAYIGAIKKDMPLLNIGRADGVRQLIANGITYHKTTQKKKG